MSPRSPRSSLHLSHQAPSSAAPHGDDQRIGRVLSRRDVVSAFGTAGLGLLFGCSSTSTSSTASTTAAAGSSAGVSDEDVAGCVVRPQQTEGPFFVDGTLERSDIRVDPLGVTAPGIPLAIDLHTASLLKGSLRPLTNARVDLWHCDAQGRYSDPHDTSVPVPQSRFLRGYQTTDGHGITRFTTIYPGWYHGRTVHIHVKIRWQDGGNHHEFTSQFYFNDAQSATIFTDPAYTRAGQRDRLNQQDGIYTEGGDQLLLTLQPKGTGFATRFGMTMM